MKKTGLLHSELSKTLAELAHDDMILIGDAGMPCPKGVKFIDLAVSKNIPAFFDVLRAVMGEMLIASAYIDIEQQEKSPEFAKKLLELVNGSFALQKIPHEETKSMSAACKAVIRTGEFTPYANIILKAGCLF
jgi:D-ribose pyranase